MTQEETNPWVFEYRGGIYPEIIRNGNACKFIMPFATSFCRGKGLDIGGVGDWTFPGARPINVLNGDGYDAHNLPDGELLDYIFSSHTLEHVDDYVRALELWRSRLKSPNGVLFLYLPHPDMTYWRPEHNRKHRHVFQPKVLVDCLESIGFRNVLASERDLYWSFAVVAFT